jgi:hypothetical protein
VPGQRRVEGGRVADVAAHEAVARAVRDGGEVGQVAGVGQLVEDGDLGVLVPRVGTAEQAADVVGADETGTAGDEQAHQRGNLPCSGVLSDGRLVDRHADECDRRRAPVGPRPSGLLSSGTSVTVSTTGNFWAPFNVSGGEIPADAGRHEGWGARRWTQRRARRWTRREQSQGPA